MSAPSFGACSPLDIESLFCTVGEVGEEVRSHIHRSLRLEFLVLSLLVTVVAMNVYIGLLGELYSKAKRAFDVRRRAKEM